MMVYVTNWSSRGLHGPGRPWSIMARPRSWETGCGTVAHLPPPLWMLDAARAGRLTVGDYRRWYKLQMFERHQAFGFLEPGQLWGRLVGEDGAARFIDQVRHGDTLCCCCSKADAAANRCHRVWAAKALAWAGWDVLLDGRRLTPPPR